MIWQQLLGSQSGACGRNFTTSSIIEHISPALFMFHLSSAPHCSPSTALATSSQRCGQWEKGTQLRCSARSIIRTDEGGRFRLNLDYFRHHAEGVDMTWDQGSPTIGRIFSDQFVRTFGPM